MTAPASPTSPITPPEEMEVAVPTLSSRVSFPKVTVAADELNQEPDRQVASQPPDQLSPSASATSSPSSGGNNNKSWLLRLFESKLFDSSMAMAYMFNSKEPGVLGYIGNKLFTYPDAELDFYLPQMVNMYVMYHEVAEVLHPYLIHR